jgi:DNA-binding NarL/FixJ family response regulator
LRTLDGAIFLHCVANPGVRFAALRLTRAFCHDARVPSTVLIVDDHPSFRASARAILEADGFEIVGEAEDGTTGLRMLRSLRPDIVLLDVQLPDMTGFDVCHECGDLDTTSVVLVSSRDAADFGSLIEKSGARGFVPKAELSGAAITTLLA